MKVLCTPKVKPGRSSTKQFPLADVPGRCQSAAVVDESSLERRVRVEIMDRVLANASGWYQRP